MPAPDFAEGRPVALTVAGSDCSAGAGIQADLRTFSTHGVFGLTAVTCVVSEMPGVVNRIEGLPPDFLYDQVTLLCNAYPVCAAKTGLFHSAEQIESLVAALDESGYRGHLVVDPVMVASSGDPLLPPEAIAACESNLFSRAELITPNLDEARVLLRSEISAPADFESAAAALRDRYGTAVLLKGGHMDGPVAVDLLATKDGEIHRFEAPAITGIGTHGSGCTLSAAITAQLALDRPLAEAVRAAKIFTARTIARSFRWNSPRGEIHALNIEQ